MHSGASIDEAHAAAGRLTGVAFGAGAGPELEGRALALASSFAIAGALGRGAEEIEHQFAIGSQVLVATFDATIARVEALFKLVFAATVAILVIAAYLPIFKLGSII